MKISLNWVKDYIDIKQEDPIDMANKITKAGVAIEKINKICDVNGLIVGFVEKVENHPNSDKLHVCIVDIEKEKLQIVCGAPNVKEGQKVIIAPIGTILPGNFEIKSVTIRDVISNGMICALEEIGVPKEYLSEEEINGIHILDNNAVVGDDPLKYLNYSDVIYELDLNPNRNDCLSVLGFAYEIGSVLGKKVNEPLLNINEINESASNKIKVLVETDKCPMYTTRIVKNIKIKGSPNFIKSRLTALGMRPINNVVDISNYVMLEYGQPLHFFDADKLKGEITVRMAREGEKTITLDGNERVLKERDIVITSGDEIVAIAGVMGCLNSAVDENTKNIVIESAVFNPYNVRYTSIDLDLRSEASIRFEKGLDPNGVEKALNRAALLLEEYAEGEILKDIVKYDNLNKEEVEIEISLDKINTILGITIKEEEVNKIFNQLGFKVSSKEDIFKVYVPTRRQDVKIPVDLIEEVGRIYGYESIEGKLPQGSLKNGTTTFLYGIRKEIRKRIEALGFYELRTYSLVTDEKSKMFVSNNDEKITILKPMSEEKRTLRQSIIPSLIDVVNYNLARNLKDIYIYELSSIYSLVNGEYIEEWKVAGVATGTYVVNNINKNQIKIDFYLMKGVVENLLDFLGLKGRYTFENDSLPKEFHPGMSANIKIGNEIIGYVGRVNPNINKDDIYVFELSISKLISQKVRGIKFKEPSKYPSISRDIAFVIDRDVSALEVKKVISKAGGNLLVDIDVFDVYEGSNIEQDKKSIAFNLTFEDNTKTLSDDEANNVINNIIKEVEEKFNAKLRK